MPGTSCAIIAHEAKKLESYFSIVKLAYDNLPDELKPVTKTDTKYKYDFLSAYNGMPLNSSIYVDTDIRGGTVQHLHITEVAYIKDLAKIYAGSKQAVPLSGRISEETTANGYNQFFDDYMMSWNNPNPSEMEYKAYFYPWFLHNAYILPSDLISDNYDEYEKWLVGYAKDTYNVSISPAQIQWRRWKKNDLRNQLGVAGLSGEQLFKQEYPATVQEAFQSGVGNVFDGEKMDNTETPEPVTYPVMVGKVMEMTIPDVVKTTMLEKIKRLDYREVKIWELPEIGKEYFIGVDPSDGEGSDYGAIAVWAKDYIKVAEYFGKLRPDELAELTAFMGEFYNTALVGVENNMITTILFLSKIYDNYFYQTVVDEKTFKRTKKLGWNTNSRTRDLMIDDFIILFDQDQLTVRSKVTIEEMRTFVKKENGKREHVDGKWDDMLFADFIAIQMIKQQPKPGRVFANKPMGL